ncbi:hypothetical protein ABFS83_08G175200 [Erythranthe nasuta]
MAIQKFHEAAGKMTQLRRKIVHLNLRWIIVEKLALFRQYLSFIWEKILSRRPLRTSKNTRGYRRLFNRRISSSSAPMDSAAAGASGGGGGYESDSDLVSLKISILGDCQTGKTSFLIKYVGDEEESMSMEMKGVNVMDKTMCVQGARISFRIWDVAGDNRSFDQVPIACKDSVAILFMFDLTSRCTLNSIIGWYNEARKWNKTAIPILIGTKFDDFVLLPPDIQWTVITQARTYARAMKATLFFSSSTHNINVNKIFKFIMAKLFSLPWTVNRNLTLGEPIIDF